MSTSTAITFSVLLLNFTLCVVIAPALWRIAKALENKR